MATTAASATMPERSTRKFVPASEPKSLKKRTFTAMLAVTKSTERPATLRLFIIIPLLFRSFEQRRAYTRILCSKSWSI